MTTYTIKVQNKNIFPSTVAVATTRKTARAIFESIKKEIVQDRLPEEEWEVWVVEH